MKYTKHEFREKHTHFTRPFFIINKSFFFHTMCSLSYLILPISIELYLYFTNILFNYYTFRIFTLIFVYNTSFFKLLRPPLYSFSQFLGMTYLIVAEFCGPGAPSSAFSGTIRLSNSIVKPFLFVTLFITADHPES